MAAGPLRVLGPFFECHSKLMPMRTVIQSSLSTTVLWKVGEFLRG